MFIALEGRRTSFPCCTPPTSLSPLARQRETTPQMSPADGEEDPSPSPFRCVKTRNYRQMELAVKAALYRRREMANGDARQWRSFIFSSPHSKFAEKLHFYRARFS